MAHLLLVESWVGATSFLLPQAITALGHRFTFVTRNLSHYLNGPSGTSHPLLHADHILTTETNDLPTLIDVVRRQHAVLQFDGVLSACDYYLEAVAHIAAALGLAGAPPQAVATARQKHRVRHALAQADLPNPAFAVTSSWSATRQAARTIGYPLVIKPVDLCAGMFVRAAANEHELEAAWNDLAAFATNARQQVRLPDVLLEAYLSGPEVSVETWTVAGETTVIGITDKSLTGYPAFIESGHMFPAALDPVTAAHCERLVVAALAAVGYTHGLAHTEVKLTADGPQLIEINVRPGGNYISELIRHVRGVNMLEAMVQLALGEHPTLEPQPTGIQSAAIQFLLAEQAGQIVGISGMERLANDPDVVAWHLSAMAGTTVRSPRDNNDYLGRVMLIDRAGHGARAKAERAIGAIQLHLADEGGSRYA